MGWSRVIPLRRKPTHNAPWAGMFESWSIVRNLPEEFTQWKWPFFLYKYVIHCLCSVQFVIFQTQTSNIKQETALKSF